MNYMIEDFYLKVDDIHHIYCWTAGNKNGIPVLYVHGGPGGNTSKDSLKYFDLNKFYVILFDQRGCGKSHPRFCIENNTTNDLVLDIEMLRKHLNIDKWIIFGGSWGSTLSLVYAINYPETVKGLILRGVFLGEKNDWNWLLDSGASYYYPEYYKKFISFNNLFNSNNTISNYYKLLTSDEFESIKYFAARSWAEWEAIMLNLKPNFKEIDNMSDEECYQIALMECHYAINNSFLNWNDFIINNVYKIKDIKTFIVHGRYDLICRPSEAYKLFYCMNNASIKFTCAGHSGFEYETKKELTIALNWFVNNSDNNL
ncbi:Proline iminopeptidase [Malacoplasma iowae]|nr:prolyl aminopeptidase [Malacoplasma iowae]VEU62908.1 Proline iminopeptidase [Mycoplasmopsis fermentans]VEU71661.1 Proline iminopeptidase [Malacoplasma iowae]